MTRTPRRIAWALIAALALPACGSKKKAEEAKPAATSAAPAPAPTEYAATIRWTGHGVPHIEASDLGSLTFGQGYAFATLHVCVLADQIVKLRGERSRFFGPGDGDANLDSDFGHLAIGVYDKARAAWPNASPESREVIQGFVAGYNQYLADVGPDGLPADCAGAEWVRPLDEIDLVAHGVQTMMLGSSGYFVDTIGAARPPGGASPKGARFDARAADSPASNGWALGADKSATGRGMLVANPHFPWEGSLRFYEAHLTIPGQLDAYGVTLLGLPLVSIGFNERVAWTHTFSSSTRFVIYRLTLVDDTTHYKYGAETRALESVEHTIDVKQQDGSLAKVTRTLYRSHYGPMLGGDMLAWTEGNAFALRDVAGGNALSIDQYLAMMRARSLDEFKAAFEKYQATPFVNTMYADADGNAWYIDGSSVPDLSAAAIAAWRLGMKSIPQLKAAWERGVVVVDGSMPLFELQTDPQSTLPGAISYERAPQLTRRDYILNANDPYWITNPDEPLAGFSPLYGEDDRAPSQRTRVNHRLVRERDKFSIDDLKETILSNRAITAELLREEVVGRCKKLGKKLARACATLDAWDGRYELDRKGALLWRELLSALPDPLWAEPFDKARPLETPRGLAPAPDGGTDPLKDALLAAADRLRKANIDPYEATLGDAQFTEKNGRRIPVHGSSGWVGITNPVYFTSRNSTLLPKMSMGQPINPTTGLSERGYPVNYGTSFLMVLGFTDDGPQAEAIMTYSASSDPKSPYFADQTEMYSHKQWRRILFRADDIAKDPDLKIQKLSAPR